MEAKANSPDVALLTERVPQEHLRRQVIHCASHGQSAIDRSLCRVEIHQLQVEEIFRYEDVCGLDISVNDTLLVQMIHCKDQLSEELPGNIFGHTPLRQGQNGFAQSFAFKIRQDHDGSLRVQEKVKGLNDVRMLDATKELKLLPRGVEELLVIHPHHLQSYNTAIGAPGGPADDAGGALAKCFVYVE
jgi:archaellin